MLVQSLLQLILLQRSILSPKDLFEELILFLIESLKLPGLFPERLYLSLQRCSLLVEVGELGLGNFLQISTVRHLSLLLSVPDKTNKWRPGSRSIQQSFLTNGFKVDLISA